MKCDAQNCDNTRGYTLAHPHSGEVKLCPAHYGEVKEAQDAVILKLIGKAGV
jgi:hypothetical protein